MASSRRRIDSGSLFWASGIFAVIVAAMAVWLAASEREAERILATGRRTKVTVLEKFRDRKRSTSTVLIRLDEVPKEEPFWRVLRDPEWERVQSGDQLSYVYEPEWPRNGILGDGFARQGLGCFLGAGSVFVFPFLFAGLWLRRREQARKRASSPG